MLEKVKELRDACDRACIYRWSFPLKEGQSITTLTPYSHSWEGVIGETWQEVNCQVETTDGEIINLTPYVVEEHADSHLGRWEKNAPTIREQIKGVNWKKIIITVDAKLWQKPRFVKTFIFTPQEQGVF